MSRYDVMTRTPTETTCVVGWDNPLQTLFAQIERINPNSEDEPEILLWIGDSTSACLDTESLAEAIAPWAVLPPSTAAKLEAERDTAQPPSRTQVTLHRILNLPR